MEIKIANAKGQIMPAKKKTDETEEAAKPKTLTKKEAAPKKKRLTKAEKELIAEEERLREKWEELHGLSEGQSAKKYVMTEDFEANMAIEHASLGWGYVLSSQNNRLEVLFEQGIKVLISNYKGS